MGRLRTGDGRDGGKTVPLRNLPHGLISLAQAVNRKVTGHIPRLPWIPMSAAHELARQLKPGDRAWEVGSGMSTLWLAPRVGRLTSIEASEEWYSQLKGIIEAEEIANVDLRYEWAGDRMSDFTELEDGSLDFLLVDGGPRRDCLVKGFDKVRAGGLIYCDNWENPGFWADTDDFLASRSADIASITSFVDFVPAQLGVYEGLIIRKA
jgi:predicted O-methyltransferase YrrM